MVGKSNLCFKLRKGKILFINTTHPLLAEELEKDGFQCDHFPGYGYDDILRIVGHYDGIVVRSKIKIDRKLLAHASSLKFVARVGAGMENIDQGYAESRGISCFNAPEGNRDAVGEQAVGMLLALFSHLIRADQEVRTGKWQREQNRGHELGGKTIGIIGYGNTGSAFARKLKGFDVEVIAYDKYKNNFSDEFARETDMEEIFEKTDILSLHVPLTDETHYLASAGFFSRFKKNIYVVNTSRGKVLNTSDLVHLIEDGKISGACLDVLEYEGFAFENLEKSEGAETFSKLVKMDQVILAPHIAGLTYESSVKMARVILKKIRALMQSKQ